MKLYFATNDGRKQGDMDFSVTPSICISTLTKKERQYYTNPSFFIGLEWGYWSAGFWFLWKNKPLYHQPVRGMNTDGNCVVCNKPFSEHI